ncbi:PadR family transcriptional regulator [Streptomyces sp. DSM 44917]|uniref:PadR family transcriptional regulator n=1 Tax=Streptomyces boetiae TaxID=3075541 RepID=A0ABU2L4B6_9ACTN|nr:PadR family transcriptional regulator [Streptomyces sp. DSM 44917]MDT0306357.1 PadR family transcriptional regulator [Streptomyces sp. DSM 44917]
MHKMRMHPGHPFDRRGGEFPPGFRRRWEGPPFDRGMGRPGGFGRPGGRVRARRGDVRAAILALLAERPMHGYEMIQELSERTGGAWRPSAGSVYPAVQLLEDEGLVTADREGGRRLLRLTDEGRAAQEAGPGERPWEQVAAGVAPGRRHLRDGIGQLVVAARQVAEAGTEEQQTEAVEIIAEARRRLYRLLAGEETTGQEARNGEAGQEDAR